jgi:hypothetical protein
MAYKEYAKGKNAAAPFEVDEFFWLPKFHESCHPSDLNTRGLEDMTNATLQRGRQAPW